MKKIDKYYLIILGISVLLMLPLINNLYFWGHDTGYHIANILAISQNISLKNLLTLKIFPIIANNFGYGAGIFYPELSHIVAAFFYKLFSPLNITVFNAIKITNFFVILLSGIFMYKFMKTLTKNNKLSMISTLFYMTAPYKLYDILVRDALAESFIFIFIPLVFLGVYYLLNGQYKKFYLNFIIGYVGLINSHLVMTIYITIFLAIILLINIKKVWNKDIIKRFIIATIVVILICLPFIIPMLTHKINGNYMVFYEDTMANPYGVYWNALKPWQYFIGEYKNLGYHFINIFAFGLTIYFIIKLIKNKKRNIKNDYLLTVGLVCTILGFWMSGLLFPWIIMPKFLLMIQFPWRLGTLTAFGISILVYYALNNLNKNQNRFIILSIISCIIVASFCLFNQKYAAISVNDYNLSEIGMGWQREYLPVNTEKNLEYFNARSSDIIIKSGKGKIILNTNEVPKMNFEVKNVDNLILELPRIYYQGYEIKAIYNDQTTEVLKYYENENGFIEINITKDAIIELDYKGTKVTKVGEYISLITIVVFGLYLVFKRGE